MARKRQQIYVVPPGGYRYVNKYGFGDFMNRVAGNPDSNGNLTTGLFKGMSGGAAAGIGAAAQAVGGLAGGLIGGGLQSGAGSVIDGLSNVASAIPGPWGAVAGAGLKVVGGLVNRMFGSKLNKENIQAVEGNINSLNSFKSNASNYDALTQNIMEQPASMTFNKKFIGKDGWFSNKAKKKFKSLQEQQAAAEQFVNNSINNNMSNISTTQAQDLLANFAALGGLYPRRRVHRYDDGGRSYSSLTESQRHNRALESMAAQAATNGLNYQYLDELRRHNRASEAISNWQGIRDEIELRRAEAANRALEQASARMETQRLNFEQLNETRRHNKATEALEAQSNWGTRQADTGLDWQHTRETIRHNKAMERMAAQAATEGLSSEYLRNLRELRRHNKATEAIRRNALSVPIPDVEVSPYNVTLPEIEVYPQEYASGGVLSLLGNGIMSPFGKRFAKGGTLAGPLHSHGADWTNGLTFVNNGSSHEANPNEGVQMGVDPEGVPNLVEEGEVIWNDYVFSNRIRVPKAVREKYKLRGQKDLTFADAVKKVQKESEERPNDPISQRGLENILVKLANAQETERAVMRDRENGNKRSQGGIAIKPSKRGTFTAAATKHGKSVQEFASQVLANPDNYSPAMVKKANFARNASKWHAYGGNLFDDGSEMRKWAEGLSDDDFAATVLQSIFGRDYTRHTDYNPDYLKNRAAFLDLVMGDENSNYYKGLTDAYSRAFNGLPLEVIDKTVLPEVTSTVERNNWRNKYYKNNVFNTDYVNFVKRLVMDEDDIEEDSDNILYNPNGMYGTISSKMETPENIVDYLLSPEYANGPYSRLAVAQYEDWKKDQEDRNKVIERGSSPLEWLRYVPAFGGAYGVFSDLMGWSNKSDYRHSDAVLEATKGISEIKAEPIGDYMRYTPMDRMFYLNQLNSLAGSTRRSALNTSGGNRGQAMAGILAADNNALNQMGAFARQAEEYNLSMKEKASEFNKDTNKFNAEQEMKARLASAENTKLRLNALAQAYALRDAQDARISAARSANLTNLFNNLGNIGIDAANRLDRNWLIRTGAIKGDMTFARNQRNRPIVYAKGGKVKRRKRGLTI